MSASAWASVWAWLWASVWASAVGFGVGLGVAAADSIVTVRPWGWSNESPHVMFWKASAVHV